ncbi:MAG TPA: MFS transporter, partial [Acidimicrobiia bacterium]|nr:MFS transporter [Acidimicrobiia bacterium]
AFFLVASMLSAVMGRWAEGVGGRRALRLAALWAAAAELLVAVGARSLVLLTVLLGFAGAANALAQPAANLVIARALPAQRQGIGFAVKQSAIPFSTFLGGIAVPALALTFGWRWAFVAAAVLAVLSAAVIPGGSAGADTRSPRARREVVVGDPVVAFPAEGGAGDGRLPMPVMVVLATGAALGAAAAGTLGAFLVSAGVASGMSEGAAGLALTLGSALGIASRLWAGALADRRSGGHLRWVAVMLALGSFGYLLFATGRPGLLVAGLPLAFGAGWAWPGLFNLAVVLANPASPGAATGVTQTGTYLGAVLGPLLFGLVAEHLSFGWSWSLAALTSWLAAAAIWTGRGMLRRSRRDR